MRWAKEKDSSTVSSEKESNIFWELLKRGSFQAGDSTSVAINVTWQFVLSCAMLSRSIRDMTE